MDEKKDVRDDPASKRHVLFLDFDGVMHRLGAVRTRRGIISTTPSIQLFEFSNILIECLEPYAILEIVLSTSWVRALGYQRARNALPPLLRERVAGATYHSKYYDARAWPTMGRGIQILRYVRTHRLTRWLAVDDEIDGFDEYLSHVVRCDERLGLGDVETQNLLKLRLAEQFL
ncbi:hydrolase [Paraburkholderia dipogonis]|uniref:Hydrolase n=1 Tax=Paraburkholderia dipogonis TaxID=1211383 RepID=A0A4Y8MXB7_9BURK|nr:HAD domain-containing protein [Paraburkholderia dipogonis]TFE42032.1 hydrolase [Paraburkholderia dipogonis]